MSLTTVRQAILLQGQTAIARKVFEHVPIQEAWNATQINAALTRATRSTMDFKVLQGCLLALRGAGLTYEPKNGTYQRTALRVRTEPMTTNTNPKHVEIRRQTPASVELLAELADRARKLAADLEAAATVIAEESEANAEGLRALSQLQSIFKSLA